MCLDVLGMNVRRFRMMLGSMMIFCRGSRETEMDTRDGSSRAVVPCWVALFWLHFHGSQLFSLFR